MKFLKTYEDISTPKFKVGDYAKYLYDKIDIYTIDKDDIFMITYVSEETNIYDEITYFYSVIKIDKNFNIIPIENIAINEKNLKKYYPTKEKIEQIELKLSSIKYNL